MNKYEISQKIKTLAELWDPFDYNDFHFKQWDFTIVDGPKGKAWIASKLIEAGNLLEAVAEFHKDLLDIIDRCCFVSQCYFSIVTESYMVVKKNNNPNNAFYLHYTKERKGVSLQFNKDEIVALKKLETFPRKPAFMYLNESTNAMTFYSRLAMLIIALESIAGEKLSNVTDKDCIKNKILKDSTLYDEIFAYGTGFRNQIFHGKEVKITVNYIEKIYKKIVEYFNTEYNTNVALNVKNPQRTFHGNYAKLQGFYKPTDESTKINFKEITEEFDKDIGNRKFEHQSNVDVKGY
jgi:hypothetical protein